MNERQVANKALELADELDACANATMEALFKNKTGAGSLLWNIKVTDVERRKQAADMLRSQERYINLLHKLLNANNIGAGRDLLTGAIIPFEVEDEHRD